MVVAGPSPSEIGLSSPSHPVTSYGAVTWGHHFDRGKPAAGQRLVPRPPICILQGKVLFIPSAVDLILIPATLMPAATERDTFRGKINSFTQNDALTAAGKGQRRNASAGCCQGLRLRSSEARWVLLMPEYPFDTQPEYF